MTISEFLKDRLTPIICSFVDEPEKIEITIITSTITIICQVKAAKEDYGKIIGS